MLDPTQIRPPDPPVHYAATASAEMVDDLSDATKDESAYPCPVRLSVELVKAVKADTK
jgi:hypothetical protein